jgi:hypothetical protein
MTADLSISAGRSNLVRLRRRIISAYQCAQEVIDKTNSAAPSRIHGLMLAYNKACNQMRVDVAHASKCFPDTDALLAWLFADSVDAAKSERHRFALSIAVRAVTKEIGKA